MWVHSGWPVHLELYQEATASSPGGSDAQHKTRVHSKHQNKRRRPTKFSCLCVICESPPKAQQTTAQRLLDVASHQLITRTLYSTTTHSHGDAEPTRLASCKPST